MGRCEALWDSSKLGDMPLEEGGVAMPHNVEGLHKGSFPPQEELSSQVEFCKDRATKQQGFQRSFAVYLMYLLNLQIHTKAEKQ